MEKISRILPSSPRFNSDLRGSGVARSGTPSFGRPVGTSALAKPAFDGMTKASDELREFQQTRVQTKPTDPKAQIVDRIANEFFMRKSSAPSTENDMETDQILEKLHDDDSDLNPVTASVRESIDDEAPVVGGKLNIVA